MNTSTSTPKNAPASFAVSTSTCSACSRDSPTNWLPGSDWITSFPARVNGEYVNDETTGGPGILYVDYNFFDVMNLPLVQGRAFSEERPSDGTSAFIVHAHAVKTSRAAAIEARRAGSTLPLDAAARFLAAPKLERFVAATVERSIDFLNGRTQRD